MAGLYIMNREDINKHRFYKYSTDGSVDTFMKVYMEMDIESQNRSSFFRKKNIKKLEGYRDNLLLTNFSEKSEEERAILVEEYNDLAVKYIETCHKSRSYGTTAFGMIPLKDGMLQGKINSEIHRVLKEYPESLGMGEDFKVLYNIFVDKMA